ncbi:DnAK-TPR [Besnoitia besnoiti]|uniref:DnAK-TPR n=1 Tax=Besnoitia besnoiti TaxID=94643 RepID=A0A2A9M4A8_BESBE|nr:DnAK-TPR [Besnoitia besnoiti]PFH32779.1 DnAK-TPR [Besnoitia besnoiti]
MAVLPKGGDVLLGLELGAQMSSVATGTREDAEKSVNHGGLSRAVRVHFMPSSMSYAGRVRLFGEEAEARVNANSSDTIMRLPMWIPIHSTHQVKTLESRLPFCPAVEVGLHSHGELFFHMDFDNQKLKIPLPVVVGGFVGRLLEVGLHLGSSCAKEHQDLSGYDLVRHMAQHPRLPHAGVLVVPSSLSPKDLQILTAAEGVAKMPLPMLSRISALVNWWCCEKLPSEYEALLRLQSSPGLSLTQAGVVHVALLDFGFSETSMAVIELRKADGEGDPAVVHQPQKQISVKLLATATAGDFGFVDVVNVLSNKLRHYIKKKYHEDIRDNSAHCWRMSLACTKAIRTLCDVEHASIDLVNFVVEHADVRFELSREHFTQLCAPLQAQLKSLLGDTLVKAGLAGTNVAVVEVFNSLARTSWMRSTIAKAMHCEDQNAQLERIRWVVDGGAGAALGAAYWAANKKYVENLVDENPPYSNDKLLTMTAMDASIKEIEARELERRFVLAALESYVFQMHQAVATTKIHLVQNAAHTEKLINEAHASAASLQDVPLEKVRKEYNAFRSYFMNSEPKLFEAIESERTARMGRNRSDPRKLMDIVVAQLDHDSRAELPNDILVKRAKHDTKEAARLLAGGQTNLSVYLAGRSLDYLSNFNIRSASDIDRTAVTEIQLQNYIQLSKAQTAEAAEDRAVDYRLGLLKEALDNCNKALAIDSRSVDALFHRATIHMIMNEFTKAKADVEAGLAVVPGSKAGNAVSFPHAPTEACPRRTHGMTRGTL